MLCENSKQCCAILNNNRCQNIVKNSSNHCEMHYGKAIKLYKKYKSICEVAYNLDLDKKITNLKENFKYLHKCYVWLNRAFNARLKHRRYAFVPECYDEGHNFQFKMLQEKIYQCEDKLYELYNNYEKVKETDSISEKNLSSEEDKSSYESLEKLIDYPQNIPKSIKTLRRDRLDNEKELLKLINYYIEENKKIIETKNILVELIIKLLKSIAEQFIKINDDNEFYIFSGSYHLIYELWRNGYFEEDYEPEKCKECNCNSYSMFNITLSCGCSYSFNDATSYFNSFSQKSLKSFYEMTLRNINKIKPLLKDVSFYFKLYGHYSIFIDMGMTWNPNLKRLIIEQLEYKPQSQSKFLASLRSKKQIFMKKYEEEYKYQYGSDSDSEYDSDSDS